MCLIEIINGAQLSMSHARPPLWRKGARGSGRAMRTIWPRGGRADSLEGIGLEHSAAGGWWRPRGGLTVGEVVTGGRPATGLGEGEEPDPHVLLPDRRPAMSVCVVPA